MVIHTIRSNQREEFDKVATHPLQSWLWGEFRERLGQTIIRLGRFSNEKLIEVSQISIHTIPHTPWTIGYCPRGPMPTKEMMEAISREAKKHRCIFVKFEPNVLKELPSLGSTIYDLRSLGLCLGKFLFTPYTFQVDLTKSEKELLLGMKPKTRYNIRLAEKKGVVVEEDNSNEAFEAFQRLTEETTIRQRFYAHGRRYRTLMWKTMQDTDIAHLLVARYSPSSSRALRLRSGQAPSRDLVKRSEILSAWVLFFFNGVAYYPYGASSNQHRELMASNLLAWRALQIAKKAGFKIFDFWGSLGPDPDPRDPWYGFHRFKEGYGGKLVEFVGTWDLVLHPTLYSLYNAVDRVRWWWLRK